jgi:hypothetical protein
MVVIHQLDVKNTFLHGDLAKCVYCHQPAGSSTHHPGSCLSAHQVPLCAKAGTWGLVSAPRELPLQHGLRCNKLRHLLVHLQICYQMVYLVNFENNIVTASTSSLMRDVVHKLHQAFAIKDLGALHFFLDVQVHRDARKFLPQSGTMHLEILESIGMAKCKPASAPVVAKPKSSAVDGQPTAADSFYHSITGALQYLTLTQHGIPYTVNQVCLHMHAPHDLHSNLIKHILRYLRSSINHSVVISMAPSTELKVYSDANWARCPGSRSLTSGYCIFLGDSLMSWSSKCQSMVSMSSAEACGVLLAPEPTSRTPCHCQQGRNIYCDNVSVMYLIVNPMHHRRQSMSS